MGFIMDYIKNDVIEEKRLINGMIKDNVPMSRIKEVTERSKREIDTRIWANKRLFAGRLCSRCETYRKGTTRDGVGKACFTVNVNKVEVGVEAGRCRGGGMPGGTERKKRREME